MQWRAQREYHLSLYTILNTWKQENIQKEDWINNMKLNHFLDNMLDAQNVPEDLIHIF